jgi:hypothetical protein
MSKVQGPERRVVHGKCWEEEEGEEAEKKKRKKKTKEEDDLFIYFFTILLNLTTPLATLSKQQLMEGERPTKE